LPGKEGLMGGGSKHTVRLDPAGNVWGTGHPLTRFDLKTKEFTRFPEVGFAYDVHDGKDGNMWFTAPFQNQIGKADWKTLQVSLWDVPTDDAYPRRMVVDSKGIVWSGLFNTGKMLRFDPKTKNFKEYPLPGPDASPYGMILDANDNIWYSSFHQDTIGYFDTKSGEVTEYPFPHSENTIREFFRDSEGKVWYGSPSNNKVGYFYLAQSAP
jgi:virginiamycin B lyase